ncbi:MAG: DUF1127 domain-containing protein [Ruegeria sp.]
MAHSVQHTQTGFSVFGLLRSVGSSIFSALISLAEAQSRVRKIQYLQSLSDQELAERGIKRERIVHHVFADSMAF